MCTYFTAINTDAVRKKKAMRKEEKTFPFLHVWKAKSKKRKGNKREKEKAEMRAKSDTYQGTNLSKRVRVLN